MKALRSGTDWVLEVLGCPFGGPGPGGPAGTDAHGEYFSAHTNFYPEAIPLPPVVYYHGYGPDGRPQGEPELIGRTTERAVRPDGVWYRVVLNEASALAGRVWSAAQAGTARASSGALPHLKRVRPDGHITAWLVAELSLFDAAGTRQPANAYAVALPALKAVYTAAALVLPPTVDQPNGLMQEQEQIMDEATMTPMATDETVRSASLTRAEVEAAVAAALKAERAEQGVAAAAEQTVQARIAAALKAERAKWEHEAIPGRRLQDGATVPTVLQFAETRRFDHLDAADQAVLCAVLQAGRDSGASRGGVSEAALKALALKLSEDQTRVGEVGRGAMKAEGIKANEVMQQALTGSGRDWVGQAYSQALWDRIRIGTFVAQRLPSVEVPQGMEALSLPLEAADPTFYKVAESSDAAGADGWPGASVTASKAGTDKKSITLAKMGARVLFSGEMEEDALVPFVPQLTAQLARAGAEQLEHAIIDGDTSTAATSNINDIANAGTQAASTLYLLFNGFRKLALVTNTANSRAGGVLALTDFLETVKLMGAAGINALDRAKVSFIVDPLTYYKAMSLAQVTTRDLFSMPTLEGGKLTGLYGYGLDPSGFIAFKGGNNLSNGAGKVDQTTPANNTKGQILAVRWDQWLLGYRRKMTTEVTRIARADVSEVVCLMRLGLINRDTEASALTYNLTP